MRRKLKILLGMFAFLFVLMLSGTGIYASEVSVTEDGKFKYSCDYYEETATIHEYLGTDAEIIFPSKIDGCKVTAISNVKRPYTEGYENSHDSVIPQEKKSSVTKIVIPDTVTVIGLNAFRGCTSLQTVTMSKNIKEVHGAAFMDCTSLESISFSKSLEKFGYLFGGYGQYAYKIGPFSGCTNLKTVNISTKSKLESIPNQTFRNCTSLESITLPSKLKYIGSEAFVFCSSLKSVTMPKSMETIGDNAFNRCTSLSSVSFNSGLKTIGGWSFANTAIKKVKLPKNVYVGNDAFHGCMKLKTVVILKGVTSHKNVFHSCENLSNVTIDPGVTSIATTMFSGTGIETLVIPETVEQIGYAAFSNCSKLKKVFFLGDPKEMNGFTSGSKVRLYGYKNSTVQTYAKSIGVRFKALNTPTKLKAVNKNKGKVKLTWKGVSGVKKYTVYRSTSENGNYKKLKTVTGKSYTDKTVKKGKTYYYRVSIDYKDSSGVKLTGVKSNSVKIKVKK